MSNERKRICVIGAGAAGLCALRNLSREQTIFTPVAYEQTDSVGGTWVYTEKTGTDEHGLTIHSSMYANLRTNLPSEIMNFPDWTTMSKGDQSCVTHNDVLDYLKSYANHFQLNQFIQFNTKVEKVQATNNGGETVWKVRVKNVLTKVIEEKDFDGVMVCNGHFFDPVIPTIPGIETFQGKVLHSHVYRKPDEFSGKTVVILGASSSGTDIGIELSTVASHVYLSHNMARLTSPLPSNLTQVHGVDRIQGNQFFLKDGTSVTADTFIYCTGYKYTFPFLDNSCGITVDDRFISPLYRHLINVEHPTMCIVGVPSTVVPFPMFHVQVQYFMAVLKDRTILPSKEKMLENSRLQSGPKRHAHRLADKQWEYNDALARDGKFDPLPKIYKVGYTAWRDQRAINLLRYKNFKFVVSADRQSVQVVQQ